MVELYFTLLIRAVNSSRKNRYLLQHNNQVRYASMHQKAPFSIDLEVRINDINYGGHMGNERFLLFFHDARLAFLKQFGMSEISIGEGVGLIMTEARIRYLAQVSHGVTLTVTVNPLRLKRARFTLAYRILDGERPVAEGETDLVAFNYESGKPVRLTEKLVAVLSPLCDS